MPWTCLVYAEQLKRVDSLYSFLSLSPFLIFFSFPHTAERCSGVSRVLDSYSAISRLSFLSLSPRVPLILKSWTVFSFLMLPASKHSLFGIA